MIPVVNAASEDFDQSLLAACREYGFVSIIGHGVDPSLFREMRSMLANLFALAYEDKAAVAITPDNYRGFIPLGFFTPNRSDYSGASADNYEGYKLHWECPADHPVLQESMLYGPNLWPPTVPTMSGIVGRYWAACDTLATTVLTIFAEAMGVEAEQFLGWHKAPLTNMTLLHYPAQDPTDLTAGMHPHKDTNVITFLHPDPVGGLTIRSRDGKWLDADSPPDALLMNIGEMLELWSGGEFPATPHQVLNHSGQERYSFPYFVVPNHSVVVEPLVGCQPDFVVSQMPVGPLSAEVWRTNWPDQRPDSADFDLGTLDREEVR